MNKNKLIAIGLLVGLFLISFLVSSHKKPFIEQAKEKRDSEFSKTIN